MKLSGRNIMINIGLGIILFVVIIINIALFISGPALKQRSDVDQVLNKIHEKYRYIETIERHSFQYITFVGESKTSYYWFDVNGKLLMRRSKNELHFDKVKTIAEERYHIKDAEVSLGYGYENAVYIIHDGVQEIYLDLDTLEEVGRLEI